VTQNRQLRRFLRRREVLEYIGLRSTALDEEIKAGSFPRPVPLTDKGRAVGWLESDLIAWQDERIAARNHKAA
jgi:prophage regulatory protein